MNRILIKQATMVNEGSIKVTDLLIVKDRIERIAPDISDKNATIINAEGLYLLPGVIDDQVHFREPGLTHKASIYSESKAAVAGGVTSFMDMPNTIPNTLTQSLLEEKYSIAAQQSLANYSFFMGINQHNLEEALKTCTEDVCGITDDGLYFNNDDGILANYPDFLERLFSRCETLVALHCEDDAVIRRNTQSCRDVYGDQIPFRLHAAIRSEEACLNATQRVLELAKRYQNRLHVFHVSTDAEAQLFDNRVPIDQKRITAEACVHHLWFTDEDYDRLGALIKWNPSIKSRFDRMGLVKGLNDQRIDIIATDHAPHTLAEKQGHYLQAHSGGPLVQHALPVMLELYHRGELSLEKIVEKMSHHVAAIYRIRDRGYIREGYYADLVLVDLNSPQKVTASSILYQCGWSPMEGETFQSTVQKTFVNGNTVFDRGRFHEAHKGMRLKFSKIR